MLLGLGWAEQAVSRAAAGPALLARVMGKQESLPRGLQLLLEDKKNSREMTPQPLDLPRMLSGACGTQAELPRPRGLAHGPAATAHPHSTPVPARSASTGRLVCRFKRVLHFTSIPLAPLQRRDRFSSKFESATEISRNG